MGGALWRHGDKAMGVSCKASESLTAVYIKVARPMPGAQRVRTGHPAVRPSRRELPIPKTCSYLFALFIHLHVCVLRFLWICVGSISLGLHSDWKFDPSDTRNFPPPTSVWSTPSLLPRTMVAFNPAWALKPVVFAAGYQLG